MLPGMLLLGVQLLGAGLPAARAQDIATQDPVALEERVAPENRAALTARWFIAAQLPSGLFDFDMDFLAGRGFAAGDNDISRTTFIVRQAGATYALAKYYAATRDPALRGRLAAALAALGRQAVHIDRPWSQRAVEWTGILSFPVLRVSLARGLNALGLLYTEGGPGLLLAYDGRPGTAWTGGTALALAAELTYARASGDQGFATLRAGWLAGMMMRRIPGGGFRDFLRSITADPYTDGESWLALSLLALADKAAVPEALAEIDAHMMRQYGEAAPEGFFHYGLMTARRRFAATGNPAFVAFALRLLRQQLARPIDPGENTCPLAEGFAAGLGLLREAKYADPAMVAAVRARAEAEIENNRPLQISPGQARIMLGGGAVLTAPEIAANAGAWMLGRHQPSIRVDMTGHCLSALVEMGDGGPP